MNPIYWKHLVQDEANPDKGGGGGGDDKTKVADGDLGTVEERAKRMGWTDQETFRGDKAKWVDAATFVENGEKSLPILRERLRTAERANMDLSKSVAEFKKMSDTAFDRAYAKAKKDLQADIKTAAKAGDEKGAEDAANELADLEREKAERKADAAKDPVFDSWAEQNPWYSDTEMKIEAEAIAFKLRRKGEKADGLPFLDLVKAEMKKQFPEKFGNPRRDPKNGSGPERPAGGGEGGGGSAKGWESLPADAKATGERYIKQKLFKDKAAYAAAYHAQN